MARAGFLPGGDDGFYQWLSVPAARLTGPAQLRVGDRDLRHREEFAEVTHLTAGGSVRSRLLVVGNSGTVRPEDVQGSVLLLPERPDGFDLNATVKAAADLGAVGFLTEWGEPRWLHKTIFGSSASTLPVLRVKRSVAAQLATMNGASVAIDLPLQVGHERCRNVVGLLPAGRPAPWVALTAHYDHVGDDHGGHRFQGAADNASGVGAILGATRLLAQREELGVNLLVAFLTGEESGLWGARHLIAHSPVPLAAAVNIDGAGIEPELKAMRVGHGAPGHWLADLAAEHLNRAGIEVRWSAGGDDSVAFLDAGVPALGLGQMSTVPRRAGVHSPDDTLANLHVPMVLRSADLIVDLIDRLADHSALAA